MRNFIIALALVIGATTFAQEQGQWSFGVGSDFTSTGMTGNAGYFVMDGLMVELEFSMTTNSGATMIDADGDEVDVEDGSTNWGIGARYYIGEDGLWAGFKMNNAEWMEMNDDMEMEEETGMDMMLAVGCSKALAFDDKLWFEPHFGLTMPAATDAMTLAMGMGFRYTF